MKTAILAFCVVLGVVANANAGCHKSHRSAQVCQGGNGASYGCNGFQANSGCTGGQAGSYRVSGAYSAPVYAAAPTVMIGNQTFALQADGSYKPAEVVQTPATAFPTPLSVPAPPAAYYSTVPDGAVYDASGACVGGNCAAPVQGRGFFRR